MRRILHLTRCLLAAFSLGLIAGDASNSVQRTLRPEELSALLEQSLRALWRVQDGSLNIEFEHTPPPVVVPAGEMSLRWLTQIQQPNRRIHPQFEIRVDGKAATTLALPVRVRWIREVWITDSPIPSQTPLSGSGLQRQSVDVLGLTGSPWAGDPALEDWVTASPIPAGGVLLERSLRRRPTIRRGDTVAARLEEGALSVEFQAVALEDGFKGGTLRLRSGLKPVELKGKVINETVVVLVR